ncbi:bacillithiol biosynthesis cysteine-adding enzyme BshC [Croceiramulus getboli]|nr:bacillithiol biosynthesis cysteine-adding enzyme BshC [Flavobacteriaceae bacterium YJPT1-3]
MTKTSIPYRDTGYFSSLINDYLDQKEELKSFYHRFPKLESFKDQIKEKSAAFSTAHRKVLADALITQYEHLDDKERCLTQIESLRQENTFTVTTGHQLNLFTGPLYFLYKIISAINLAKQLQEEYTDYHFVPIYWMASEDHDFEEINFFNFEGKKVQWNRQASGPVGELNTQGLEEVYEQFCAQLGSSPMAQELCTLFEQGYLKHDNLTAATRTIAHQLFKEYGLVIVDGNDRSLKEVFVPLVKKELEEQIAHREVTDTTKRLTDLGYSEQVHPREINLFYIKKGLRERILKKDDAFYVNETELRFTQDELWQELEQYPERFSPNALLRPLYQEVILPNLCYIGGGGELAYWFQLKDYFGAVEVPFPILLLRNSALLRTAKQKQKADRLDVSLKQLFLKRNDLINQKIRVISNIDINFAPQKEHLIQQFEALYALAEKTDASFLGAVKAQEVKQLKGLDHLEHRLLKAQKRKLSDQVERLAALQEDLFPRQSLQERTTNFADFYKEYGSTLITQLRQSLDPLELQFTVITFDH